MKDDVYYIKLYFNFQKNLEKDILSFLDSLGKIKNIQFSFSFLDKSGLETVRKMKKIQENNKFEFCGRPLISNEEERRLSKNFYKENRRILLIIARCDGNIKNTIDGVIKKHGIIFCKIDKKIARIHDLDIVTPLNMRGDIDVLRLTFLLSKCAIKLLDIKRELNLENFPNMFLGIALIFDLEKIFKKQKITKGIIRSYYLYLLDYFKFDKKELLSLKRVSKKYIKIIKEIDKKNFSFQNNKMYANLVNGLSGLLVKDDLLIKINNKFKDKNLYWIFFHWFNNSLNTHFAQEIVLLFALKKFYEEER